MGKQAMSGAEIDNPAPSKSAAISHVSYSSLRGRHPAWHTARATR